MAPYVLFITTPDHGHLNPMLAPARLLQQQGYRVAFACLECARQRVEAAQLRFISLGPAPPAEEELLLLQQAMDPEADPKLGLDAAVKHFVGHYGLPMAQPLLQLLQQEGERPDVLVADLMCGAGFDVAELLGLPLVVAANLPLSLVLEFTGHGAWNYPLHTPLESMAVCFPEHMTWAQKYLLGPLLKRLLPLLAPKDWAQARNDMRRQLGLAPLKGALTGLQGAVPRSLHLCGITWDLEVERPLPPGWHLTGPMGVTPAGDTAAAPRVEDVSIREFLEEARAAGAPVIYVATGTVVTLRRTMVQAMAAGLAGVTGARVLWSLKEAQHADLEGAPALPQHLLLVPWAPQTAVLAHPAVKVFLSHGGMNSTNEGLAAGVPVLCMPFGGDQPINAQHIENKGVGLQVRPKGLSPAHLTSQLHLLLKDPSYAAAAADMGARLRGVNGPATTAALIAEFAGTA